MRSVLEKGEERERENVMETTEGKRTRSHTQTHTQTDTHTHRHTQTHRQTQTQTHTQTDTQKERHTATDNTHFLACIPSTHIVTTLGHTQIDEAKT